ARSVAPLVLSVFLGALALTGCESIFGPGEPDGPPPEITQLPRPLTTGETEALGASNRFGFDLLQVILTDAPSETHFLSPLSASMALGMALNGADGGTRDAMRAALRFDGLGEEEINDAYLGLLTLLDGLDPRVWFQIANGVWYRDGLTPRQGFLDRVTEHFGAAVEGIDFTDPAAAELINAWVEDATGGRIEDMVAPPIPGNVVAMLLNAIHFKGDWREKFDAVQTTEAPFHGPDGPAGTVDLMEQDEDFRYHFTPSYAAVELPYGGGAFVMDVIVPAGDEIVAGVLGELADGGWAELTDALAARSADRVHVLLPRFELEWERTLNDDLSEMGMGIAFGGGADFTRMFEDSNPYIDEVRQKSFVRVDEEGTEAAAATLVVMADSAPPEIRADRPFLFAIRERLSGTILFLGAVMEAPPAA
ncbi:MAG: serpin family protein, partial [Gemmatimonadota bacterium]